MSERVGDATDLRDLLPLHALGALDADQAEAVERAVAADPALRGELDAYRAAAGELPAALAPVPPPPALRDRLLASVDATVAPSRFDHLAARVAAIFDVTLDKARMFLGWIDDPARWEPSPLPAVRLVHLPAGPMWAGADCGLVRMPAGFAFPWHAHLGEELTLVLQGRARTSDGEDLGPGTELVLREGAQHDFVVDPASEEYIFAVRFHGIVPLPKPPRGAPDVE